MEFKSKVVMIDKHKCQPNPLNPRRDLDTTDIDPSVREKGVMSPIMVNQDYVVYRGHRRLIAIMKTAHEQIPCIIVDDTKMSDTEKFDLLLDHSQEKPLSKSESYIAIKEFFRLGYGEVAVIKRCYSILNLAFGAPSPEKIAKAKAEAIATHDDPDRAEEQVLITKHRGTIQNMKRLAMLPDMVAEEYLKAWQGNNSLLTQKDVLILAKLWDELVKADASITRQNPPQVFTDKVAELMAINETPDEGGEKKAVKRTKADIEDMMKACEDVKVRLTLAWVLGDSTRESFLKSIKEANGK